MEVWTNALAYVDDALSFEGKSDSRSKNDSKSDSRSTSTWRNEENTYLDVWSM